MVSNATPPDVNRQILSALETQTSLLRALASGLTPPARVTPAATRKTVTATTAFSLPALRDEVLSDPAGLGLSALVTTSDYVEIARRLNAVGAGPSYVVYDEAVTSARVINAIPATDYALLTTIQFNQFDWLLRLPLDCTIATNRDKLNGVFATASGATVDAVAQVQTRQGSRAEVLWGTRSIVTEDQVRDALS